MALTLGGCKPAPAVISTNPADGATGVPITTTVTATFTGTIDPESVNATTFTLYQGATQVPGQVVYDAETQTATFTPAAPLAKGSLYTATIAKGTGAEKSVSECLECYGPILAVPVAVAIIAALAAPPPGLPEDFVWTFTTVAGNKVPIADAGPDQQVNLPIGAETVAVTLDGSGSTDPAKVVVSYFWTGTPDPENIVNPTVILGAGYHVFTLIVGDNEEAPSAPDTVTIFVNIPPVANADAGEDQEINLPAGATTVQVTLDGSASTDSDGTVVAFEWTGVPDPDDVVNPVVTVGPGVHVFSLIVTDNQGATSLADTVTITVNTPPVANAGPDQLINLPLLPPVEEKASYAGTVNVTLDGSASHDSDGTIVSYAWTGPVDPEDIVSPTVTLGAGDHEFSLVVTDDSGSVSVADTVVISVNTPPTADAGPDQRVNLPLAPITSDKALYAATAEVTLDGSASFDSDGTIASYAWAGTPDPADAVNPTIALGTGTHVFTLLVTDNDGAVSEADTVTITVNTPPTADAGPDQFINLPLISANPTKAFAETVDVTLDGSGSTDSDGSIASYEWIGTPDPADTISPTVTLDAGDHIFSLVVTDNDGAVSVADTVSISVNTPPVADAGPDRQVSIAVGQSSIDVTLDGSASFDSDGTIASYAWTGTLDPADVETPTVNLGAGQYTFVLTVTDNDGAVSEADTMVVNVNVPPVADAGPDRQVSIAVGQTSIDVTLDGNASSDSDGTIASYAWTGTLDPADVVNPTVNLGAGEYTFVLTVTDNDGAVSAADTVTIFVNLPPVADAGPDRQVNIPYGEQTVNVTLDGSASTDSDGTIAAYNWTGTVDPADVVFPTVSLGSGTHVFTLVVTDDDGAASAADTVTISVNASPVAYAGSNRYLNLPLGASTMDVTLDGSGSTDSDGTIVTYTWTGSPDPADIVGPTVTVGAGMHNFYLTVTDDKGADSNMSAVILFVNAPPVANAGPDQNVNLPFAIQLGKADNTVDVTLDGSLSADSDGNIAVYTWTGAVDPADVVNPVVSLDVGEHEFTLVVTDDRGSVSYSDTVTIFVNSPPVAYAGEDQNLSLPLGDTAMDVTLDGSASYDFDGSVASYAWTGTIDPADTVNPVVSLTAGDYVFSLIVTDNSGAASVADTVAVSVNAPPVANAGPDQLITLPFLLSTKAAATTVDVTLDGSLSTDSDGTVASYAWAGLVDPDDVESPVVNLPAGVHEFTLTVTDNDGAVSAQDTVIITVNQPPVANAGTDQQINLPAGASAVGVSLSGSASSDPDGTIAAYTWTGAPDPDDTVNPDSLTLPSGTYVFTLTVTDNLGAVSEPSTVTIVVNQTPVANAGLDQNRNLPLSVPSKGVAPATMNVQLSGASSYDLDGTIETYSWTGTPDPADSESPMVNLPAGVHVFTLTVTDNKGAVSEPDSVTITVNTPPVAVVTATPNPSHADTAQPAILTYDPTVLYGLQQYSGDALSLDYLDPADGLVTKSLPVVLDGTGWEIRGGFGLAVDPTTGTFWAIIEAMDPSEDIHLILATIDPLNGVAQYVAEWATGPQPYDLAFVADGTLVAVANTPVVKAFAGPGLYLVDKTDGTLTEVVEFTDSSGFDAIVYISAFGLMGHAYRNTSGESFLEGIDPVTFDITPLPAALPAEAYNWQFPTALTIDADTFLLFLSEDVDTLGKLSTIAVGPEGGVETLLQPENVVYGGLAFGYTKTAVPEIVQLDGSTSFDPDGDNIATYAWSVTSVPAGSAVTGVSDPAIAKPTLTPDLPGDYTVELVVNDGKTDSAPATYVVTYENTAPVADAGVDVLAEDSAFLFEACLDGSASFDADFDALTYSWVVTDGNGDPVPGFFTPSDTSAAVCFTFSMTTPEPGDYTATLTVTEDKPGGLSATDTATITLAGIPPAN
jgi:hypothetical protein